MEKERLVNLKAKLRKKWAIIVTLIIAVAAVGIYALSSAVVMHTSSSQFGNWGQQIILEYSDGSTIPLGQFNPFAVRHSGVIVSAIHYKLYGKATGTATSLQIFLSSYNVTFKVGTTPSNTYVLPFTETLGLTIDNQWHEMVNIGIPIATIVGSLPVGTYPFTITPDGSITYSIDGGIPIVATLPSSITEELVIS